MKKISCVIPCYNEEKSLSLFFEELCKVEVDMKNKTDVSFENIFINDGSTDKTLDLLKSIIKISNDNRYISFSRNFGKEAAIYAGLKASKGDYIVCIDADLQHPPEKMELMYREILLGKYDSVCMRRVSREGEPKLRSFFCQEFLQNN